MDQDSKRVGNGADGRAGGGERRAGETDSPFAATRSPLAMSNADRTLVRRLTIFLSALFLFTFAYSRLQLLYGEKFFEVTASGKAQWIWMQHRLADGNPVAFYATHDFDLPPQRLFTHLKVLGDPEYTLFF